jgi:hypothetical protein
MALSPQAATAIRAVLHDLLRDSIPETLYRMGMAVREEHVEAPPAAPDATPAEPSKAQ